MSRGTNDSLLGSLLDENRDYLAGKMAVLLGSPSSLRSVLVLHLLSAVAYNHSVLFLHSKLHFPIDRFKELAEGDDRRLQNVRLLYLPDFAYQERIISLSELFMIRDNFRYLFFDDPTDNYIDSLSVNWNVSSALKGTHSSFIRQLATLKTLSFERGIGVLLTLDSNDNKMIVPKYAVEVWPDLILALEQVDSQRGRLNIKTKTQGGLEESHEITVKKEGVEME